MSNALARCPFCGSTNFGVYTVFTVDGVKFFGQCAKCGASGPAKKTQAKAKRAWNWRTIEHVLRGELEDARKELERLRNDLDGQCINLKMRNERDQARAELAEMKARDCKTCGRYAICHMCIQVWDGMMPVKSCSAWEPRKEQP